MTGGLQGCCPGLTLAGSSTPLATPCPAVEAGRRSASELRAGVQRDPNDASDSMRASTGTASSRVPDSQAAIADRVVSASSTGRAWVSPAAVQARRSSPAAIPWPAGFSSLIVDRTSGLIRIHHGVLSVVPCAIALHQRQDVEATEGRTSTARPRASANARSARAVALARRSVNSAASPVEPPGAETQHHRGSQPPRRARVTRSRTGRDARRGQRRSVDGPERERSGPVDTGDKRYKSGYIEGTRGVQRLAQVAL